MLEGNDIAFIVKIMDNAQIKGIEANVMMVNVFQKLQVMAKKLEPVASPAVTEGVKEALADDTKVIDIPKAEAQVSEDAAA
jgi:hypothetical protein